MAVATQPVYEGRWYGLVHGAEVVIGGVLVPLGGEQRADTGGVVLLYDAGTSAMPVVPGDFSLVAFKPITEVGVQVFGVEVSGEGVAEHGGELVVAADDGITVAVAVIEDVEEWFAVGLRCIDRFFGDGRSLFEVGDVGGGELARHTGSLTFADTLGIG